ncbi:MAG TPA: nuclear transport factor 2 family protein [Polyangiaceae bacterium]
MGTRRLLLLLPLLATLACAEAPLPPPAAPRVDLVGAGRDVARELDDFHDAAAHADETRLFGHFAQGGVFLGTDATERWDVPAFRAYAHPRFADGKGWVFHVERRAVSLSADGKTAWFDEDLRGDALGPARGSGVLQRQGGRYLIAQYNLAITVPNERFSSVRAFLDAPPPPPPPPDLRTRYKTAYQDALLAAKGGDLTRAAALLVALVPEAKTLPGDDMEFWLRNELTWLRWGQGDLAGALAQVDAARVVLDHASLPEAQQRALRLHERWDRAYLLLELAQKAPRASRAAALTAARDAKRSYDDLAGPSNDHDGMAVLEAFFALRARDGRAALAAAKRVNVEQDSDLQDLYVLSMALDLGGDHGAARFARDHICAGKDYLMKPLLLQQLAREGTRCPPAGGPQ